MTPNAAQPVSPVSTDTCVATAAGSGALAMLPLLASYIPFALVVGSNAADHGAALAGWAGSFVIFGGSAQLAAMRTLEHAGPQAAILTGVLVNARLLVYSTSLARRWSGQPRWFRVVAAGLIIDPTWAAAERHAGQCTDLGQQRRYFLAAGLTLAAGWSGATAVGALIGARLGWLDLQIFIPLCLLGLVGAGLRAGGSRSVMIVAAAVALLTASWPDGTGLLAAIVAGCATGLTADRRSHS